MAVLSTGAAKAGVVASITMGLALLALYVMALNSGHEVDVPLGQTDEYLNHQTRSAWEQSAPAIQITRPSAHKPVQEDDDDNELFESAISSITARQVQRHIRHSSGQQQAFATMARAMRSRTETEPPADDELIAAHDFASERDGFLSFMDNVRDQEDRVLNQEWDAVRQVQEWNRKDREAEMRELDKATARVAKIVASPAVQPPRAHPVERAAHDDVALETSPPTFSMLNKASGSGSHTGSHHHHVIAHKLHMHSKKAAAVRAANAAVKRGTAEIVAKSVRAARAAGSAARAKANAIAKAPPALHQRHQAIQATTKKAVRHAEEKVNAAAEAVNHATHALVAARSPGVAKMLRKAHSGVAKHVKVAAKKAQRKAAKIAAKEAHATPKAWKAEFKRVGLGVKVEADKAAHAAAAVKKAVKAAKVAENVVTPAHMLQAKAAVKKANAVALAPAPQQPGHGAVLKCKVLSAKATATCEKARDFDTCVREHRAAYMKCHKLVHTRLPKSISAKLPARLVALKKEATATCADTLAIGKAQCGVQMWKAKDVCTSATLPPSVVQRQPACKHARALAREGCKAALEVGRMGCRGVRQQVSDLLSEMFPPQHAVQSTADASSDFDKSMPPVPIPPKGPKKLPPAQPTPGAVKMLAQATAKASAATAQLTMSDRIQLLSAKAAATAIARVNNPPVKAAAPQELSKAEPQTKGAPHATESTQDAALLQSRSTMDTLTEQILHAGAERSSTKAATAAMDTELEALIEHYHGTPRNKSDFQDLVQTVASAKVTGGAPQRSAAGAGEAEDMLLAKYIVDGKQPDEAAAELAIAEMIVNAKLKKRQP